MNTYAYATHGFAYKGIDKRGGGQVDFVACRCGTKIIFDFTREDPFKKIAAHIKAINEEASKNKCKFKDTIAVNGLSYVRCECGWQKKLKTNKDPQNVWEGHRGFTESQQRKEDRGRHTTGEKVKNAAKSFWNGQNYGYGNYWQKATWDKIEPIANEIFGGTFFVAPNHPKQ